MRRFVYWFQLGETHAAKQHNRLTSLTMMKLSSPNADASRLSPHAIADDFMAYREQFIPGRKRLFKAVTEAGAIVHVFDTIELEEAKASAPDGTQVIRLDPIEDYLHTCFLERRADMELCWAAYNGFVLGMNNSAGRLMKADPECAAILGYLASIDTH